MPTWEGVIASIITPLKNGGSQPDTDAMRKYCDFIVSKGVNGIFALGTTGEGPLLSLPEKKLLAETVVDQVNQRMGNGDSVHSVLDWVRVHGPCPAWTAATGRRQQNGMGTR